MLLSRVLRPLIRIGRLTVIDAGGIRHVFGTESEPAVTVRLHDSSFLMLPLPLSQLPSLVRYRPDLRPM